MNDKDMLGREDLFNLLTCDPVTTRGMTSLINADLAKIITQDYFFKNLYVDAKVEKSAITTIPDDELQYPYIESAEEHDISHYMYKRFKSMLLNDAPNSYPLLLLASAGNGKSVEVLHQLWQMQNDDSGKYNYFYCNFEKSYSELTHGIRFRLNPKQTNEPLWLIAMTILNTLYKLIEENKDKTEEIYNNHKIHFLSNGSADNAERVLFKEIKQYKASNPITHQRVFKALIGFIANDERETIENLIKIAMNVLYCINPQRKNILVFDNLEFYIKINYTDIPIHNSTLRSFYEILQRVSGTMEDIYNRISVNESWRAFKIIMAIRRTSTRLIMRNSNEQFVAQMLKKGQDITNYFNIWEIWYNKRELVWKPFLKQKYSSESSYLIDILNDMMSDTPGRLGTSYQERIAVLMNTSLRRNASAQAYAAYSLYEILFKDTKSHINYETYKVLLKESNSARRYFYRHMLLELQYRRMMYSREAENHFNKLRLLDNSKSCTLVRRVLGFLSHFKDNQTCTDEKGKTLKSNMYETVPLYKLMKQIFLSPSEIVEDKISEKYNSSSIDSNLNIIGQSCTFSELATVLIALANMNNYVNKSAPFVILGINDSRFNEDSSEEELTIILKEIWDAGALMSQNNNKYDKLNYGVRLTDAGAMFVFDIQPSFSFFASLKDKNAIPLFLHNDKCTIKKIIEDVYSLADSLCEKYENAAASFCGRDSIRSCKQHYLPNSTFRNRVKSLHINHLILYRDFIEKDYKTIGLDLSDKDSIIKHIEDYIQSYENWDTSKECF